MARGFGLSGIINATSALPYNISTGLDNNRDTVFNDRPVGAGRNSARGKGRLEIGTRLSWGKDFGPEQKQGGAVQMRMVRMGVGEASAPSLPGGSNKQFHLEFYAQVFNLLNHTNLQNFSGVQTSPFFGQATSAQGPRRMEVGVRLNF